MTPRAAQQLQDQGHQAVRDPARRGVPWASHQAEPPTAALPSHVNLRVLWLSGVWTEAYDGLLAATVEVRVPTYATSVLPDGENAA